MAESIGNIKALPTLPAVLTRIIATTADPDASALELSRHIASDQSLAATLLKLVNSAYYGHYRQVDSVTGAIVMLGFHEVRNLALAATVFRTFPQGHPDFDRAQLWRHSLATGIAAESLSKMTNAGAGGSFVAGLLHDMGKVAFDVVHPRLFRDAAHKAHTEGCFIRETELEILGLTHAQAGGILAERWSLPIGVVEAVRFHHNSTRASALTHLTALADYVAYQAEFGESCNGREPIYPESAASLNVREDGLASIAEHLRKSAGLIEEFVGALR